MSTTRTKTLERPEVTTTEETQDDAPKFFHYVDKSKIAESAVMGTYVIALCGGLRVVDLGAKLGSPVCPECKRVYETLKPGE